MIFYTPLLFRLTHYYNFMRRGVIELREWARMKKEEKSHRITQMGAN